MNTPSFSSTEFMAVAPAAVFALGAMVLMLSEVFLTSTQRGYQALVAAATSSVAIAVALKASTMEAQSAFGGFAVLDPFSSLLTVVVGVGAFLSILVSTGFLRHRNAERGEYYALVLFAAAGMSLLAVSAELISLFVNLEVMSIATYALTAYLRRGSRPSEAGFKYFFLGAFAGAVLLYGTALLYGATGTTELSKMSEPLRHAANVSPGLTLCGLALLLAGFAFKIAAVPFHMWTPDVYEGAPTPITALMSAGVKAAAFVAMVRVFTFVAPAVDASVLYVSLATLAALTMVAGNLLAIPQRNVKRMLAYSSIAHAGYLLLGVTSLFAKGSTAGGVLAGSAMPFGAGAANGTYRGLLFYLFAYTVTTIGAFGLLAAVELREDETRADTWDLDKIAGLAQRRPFWAVAMAAFMLSLGGVPPTVGFIAKLMLFQQAIDSGLIALAVIGVLSSAAGIYYYLRVVVYMFMRPVSEGALPQRHWATETALVLSALAVVGLGLFPSVIADVFPKVGGLFGAN